LSVPDRREAENRPNARKCRKSCRLQEPGW
jgi:hypothetical protein